MSLLLDALKRAEEAKRARLSAESAAYTLEAPASSRPSPDAESTTAARGERPSAADTEPPDFSLEDYKEVIPPKANIRSPLIAMSTTGDRQRGAELGLEHFPDAQPIENGEEESPRSEVATAIPALPSRLDSTGLNATQLRDTARNVFTAKQATSPGESPQKKWLLPVIAVVLVAVGSGGWYVWNEVSRMSRPAAANIATRPMPASSLPPAQPATGQPGVRQPDENTTKPVALVEPPLPPLLPPPAGQAPLPTLALRTPAAKTGTPLTEREALAKSLMEAPASKEAPVELKLTRSIEAPAVSTDLLDAYAALKSGDYSRARALYAKLVLADPMNLDAQLGMATVLARSGDLASAARHYRQVLAIDPRNGAALAGLLAVRDARSPSLEIELMTLVGRNPESSSLRFTLGNLYASERRWVEAQQAYFEAYRLESDNADYMYNLAVSLDQLKQPKLALDYYQKAFAAGSRAGGQFDRAAVVRRIKELAADSSNN